MSRQTTNSSLELYATYFTRIGAAINNLLNPLVIHSLSTSYLYYIDVRKKQHSIKECLAWIWYISDSLLCVHFCMRNQFLSPFQHFNEYKCLRFFYEFNSCRFHQTGKINSKRKNGNGFVNLISCHFHLSMNFYWIYRVKPFPHY